MATHSSSLAWRIPGMEERGGLPSMGSHRVRHDWSDIAAAAAAAHHYKKTVFSSYSGFEIGLCASYLAFHRLYIVFLSVLVFALFLNSFHDCWMSNDCGFWIKPFRNFLEPGCTGFAFMELMVCGEFTYLLSIYVPSSLCFFHIGLSFYQMLSSFVLYSFQITKEWCRVIACYGNVIFSSDIWLKNGHTDHQGQEPWGELQGWTSGKDTHVLERNGNKGVSFCFWHQQWGSKHAIPKLDTLAC